MAKIKKVFNTVYIVISTAVITVGVILVVLLLCGIRLYSVQSGSMGELLPVGSVCFVSTYSKYENIEYGDVISFRVSDGMRVTHRVVKVTAEGVYTQGDMNKEQDPDPVTKENYIGKTVFALPYLGAALGFFHTLWGKIAICFGILLLVIAGVFYKKTSE
ncbi:MAG: signal peptidase I [Ruminococcus sp.]|nr:signal peptidase I [Ruminococcus sp.]